VLIGVDKNSEVTEHRTFASVVENFRFVKLLVKRNWSLGQGSRLLKLVYN